MTAKTSLEPSLPVIKQFEPTDKARQQNLHKFKTPLKSQNENRSKQAGKAVNKNRDKSNHSSQRKMQQQFQVKRASVESCINNNKSRMESEALRSRRSRCSSTSKQRTTVLTVHHHKEKAKDRSTSRKKRNVRKFVSGARDSSGPCDE